MDEKRLIQVILPLRLDWEPYYYVPAGVDVAVGDRLKVNFAGHFYMAVVSSVDPPAPSADIKIVTAGAPEADTLRIPERDIEFWRKIASYYMCTVGEVYRLVGPPLRAEEKDERRISDLLKRASNKTKLLEKARASTRTKAETIIRLQQELDEIMRQLRQEQGADISSGEAPDLNFNVKFSPAQDKALLQIKEGLAQGKPVLLEGVTGSGKTELYLQLACETLRAGKNVLYLVPEIALSRQLEDRIARVVPFVQVYHSRESIGRRNAVAAGLRREGVPYMILGTRMSLFLSHHNLGLVIVDEEHDRSYKQDSPAPRYHARETAILLAGLHGAGVVLGSATPSLESAYNARIGRFTGVELKEAYYKGGEASVQIIDMVAERKKRGVVGSLSRKLIDAISETITSGGQVLLLRSRRAFSPAVQCIGCGAVPRCPKCNVPLSYHTSPRERLLCHYCGYGRPYTGTCKECGGELQPIGSGTQKVEQELQDIFPQARIGRMDSDIGPDPETIRSFAKGEIDILIGTQMLTKGFDFAGVALVSVVMADDILSVQDFRADEYALHLLEQFKGRCGRRGTPGRFIVQTRVPAHPVLQQLAGGPDPQDEAGMLDTSLEERRLFSYPPFTRIVLLSLRDKNPQRLAHQIDTLAENLRALQHPSPGSTGPQGTYEQGHPSSQSSSVTGSIGLTALSWDNVMIIGPYAPVNDHIGGEYVRSIRIMLPRDKHLLARKAAIYRTVRSFETSTYRFVAIDVDPV